jgi:hypothetical protein
VPVLASLAGCAQTLPEQDRRIYATTPVAKLSADILAKDYQADPVSADRQYWGKVLEVSGEVTATSTDGPHADVIFGQEKPPDVRATLLDDEAKIILEAAKVGERITLRCFCEGADGDVRLTSCVGVK